MQLEWRIQDIERKINNAPKDYEYHALVSRVDSLERSMRETSTNIAELSYTIQTSIETIEALLQRIEGLELAQEKPAD